MREGGGGRRRGRQMCFRPARRDRSRAGSSFFLLEGHNHDHRVRIWVNSRCLTVALKITSLPAVLVISKSIDCLGLPPFAFPKRPLHVDVFGAFSALVKAERRTRLFSLPLFLSAPHARHVLGRREGAHGRSIGWSVRPPLPRLDCHASNGLALLQSAGE